MKNSHILQKELSFEYHTIMECDLIEIDNVDLHNPIRLNYLDRLRLCLNIIQSKFPDPKDISIGDFACAQGNIGLSLAELGYNVFAVDINPVFINYSKKKYEKGNIQWIVSEISDLTIKPDSLDVVIIGELIEHCAYPEEIIKKILEFVRVGGYVLLTTPNGSNIFNRLPTFADVQRKSIRKKYEALQFGPAGRDHLFFFKLDEIKLIVPKSCTIEKCGYCGGTILYNKITKSGMKVMPTRFLENFPRSLSKIPIVNQKFCQNIYALVKKDSVE